jgi:PAS domain S-box-containing protein
MKQTSDRTSLTNDSAWKPDTILIVEDDDGLNHLITKKLKRDGFQTISVFNGADAVSKACEDGNLCLLLDYKLPDMTANDILDRLTEVKKDFPFIVMTGHGDEHLAVELMKRGAIDYLVKDSRFIDVLPQKIHRACDYVAQQRKLAAAEEALRASEELHRTLLDISPDEVTVTDLDGRIQKISQRTQTIHGFKSVDEVIGKNMLDIIAPEDHEKLKLNLKKIQEQGFVRNIEYEFLRKDGSRFIGELSASLLKDKDNNPSGFITTTRDITERKQAEEKIKKAKKAWEDTFDSMVNGVSLHGPDHIIHNCNDTLAKMLGKKRDDIIGKKCYELFHNSQKPIKGCPLDICLESKQPCYVEVFEPLLKKHLGISTSPTYDDKEKLQHVVHTIYDITERKQAETVLEEERNLLRTLIDNLPDLIYAKDTKSRYFISNRAHKRFLNAETKDDIIGKSVFDLYSQELAEHYYADDQQVIRSGKPIINREEKSVNDSGKSIWNLTTKVPLRDRDGKIMGLVGIARDITEQKKAEEQIQKDLTEKTILLSEVHHRVKNSLQVVASLLQLQSRKIEDENILDLFNQSRNRIYMMAAVYEKLYESKNFASIDFKEYLEDVLNKMYQMSAISHRVSFKMDINNVVLGLDNAVPVALILNELFTNSIKHAFPEENQGEIEIKFNLADEETYRLVYRDNGVGLPDGINFETTETLGLNLVKNLARQIEGEVTHEQTDWTIFKIVFKGYEFGKKKYKNN